MKLICCMIARNNELTLARAIQSVIHHVDQIIVCDTGSKDGTMRVAEELGATVHSIDWTDDFSKARNQAISLVEAEWVLTIDADEEFVWDGDQSLKEWVSGRRPQDEVILFDCFHYEEGAELCFSITHVERLFSPLHFMYKGKIHETLVARENAESKKRAVHAPFGHYDHYGYASRLQASKNRRNLRLLQMAIDEEPENGGLYRYLANEYYNCERYETCLRFAMQALRLIPLRETYLRAQTHYYLIMALLKLEKFDQAVDAARICIAELPTYPDAYGILGELYFYNRRWQESYEYFSQWERCMERKQLLPNYSFSIRTALLAFKRQTEVLRHYAGRREKGICDLKVLILVSRYQLERDWTGFLRNVKERFRQIQYDIGIWMNENHKEAEPKLGKSWMKDNRIFYVHAHDREEAGIKLGTQAGATHVWFWEANERLMTVLSEEMVNQTLSEAGAIVVRTRSERLGYHKDERRIWPIGALKACKSEFDGEAAAAIHESVQSKKMHEGSHTICVEKPLLIPLENRHAFTEAYGDSDTVQQLLTAFGGQQYERVLAMEEPEAANPEWAVFRFYRILSAYSLNLTEQASEWLYEAMEAEVDERTRMDFIYMYGKLAQNANVTEMKLEAIDLLETTLQANPFVETHYVVSSETDWLAALGELQWQTGDRKQAIVTMRHSLESSNFANIKAAYRLAEFVYESFISEGTDKVARVLLEMLSEQTVKAKALLYPVFSYLNLQEWAFLFQQAWTAVQPAAVETDREPLVSIILPVYNDKAYLGEAIHSLLSQTYLNLEIIVVDDGSETSIAEIVKRYQYDRRIKLYRLRENRGLPFALNYGIAQSKGTIMGWTSADNRAHPRWIERMVEELSRHSEASAVYSDYYHIDEEGLVIETKRMSAYKLNGLQNGGPSLLWKASALRCTGGFDESLFGIEDRDFAVRLAMAGSLIRLPEPLYYYRIHGGSLSSRIDSGSLGGWNALHDKLKQKWLHLSFI